MKSVFRQPLFFVLAALVAFTTLRPPLARADNLYASIRGTVTDPSGAVIAGMRLTARNSATGVGYTTTSGKDGAFSFLQLPIGDYTVTAEGADFKRFESHGIHLDLNQVYVLQVEMQVGAVAQTVTVEANAVQVERTSMQLGTTISGDQLVDIPLNGRDWTQMMQLEPGIVAGSDRFGTATIGNTYSGNGAETQQNSFLINGADSNDISLNTPLLIPSLDAIAEFRLIANTLNPEYGRNSGTIINAVIKSGSNAFHGDGFEFYRDTFLDSKTWFENQPSPFHRHDFGGTVGGPVVKDHSFFFFSYSGRRQREPQAFSVPTVFSLAQRMGDFSADAGRFSNVPIPFAMFGDNASPCPATGAARCPAGSATYAQLFSTGVIPTVDFNPLALKLVDQFVPLPNGPNNQFLFNPFTTDKFDQYIYRVDEQIHQHDALWFSGFYQTEPSTDTLPFTGSTLPGFPAKQTSHIQQYTIAWNHSFSPTTLNEARFSYTRFNFNNVVPVLPINPTNYGFSGILPQVPADASLPVITVAGLFTVGFSINGPQPRVQNTYQVVDNFSKVVGRHTLKAGFNMDREQLNNPFFNNLGGNFSFSGSGVFSTSLPGVDFLLGIPDSYAQGSGSVLRARAQEYYSYVQDQWQVRPNLVLTIGTGWDIETPWRNLFGNGEIMGAFRPGEQSRIFPTMPVGFVYPGDPGVNQYGGPTIHYNDLAPRFGFAWSPTASGRWSIRGGIGLYYNRSESELSLQTLTNPPFAITSVGATSACGSPEFATPFVGITGTCSTPQAFPFVPPAPGSRFDPARFEPIGFGFVGSDPRLTAPRSTNYNLTVERQLSPSTILSIAYVGNQGRRETGAYDANLAGLANGTNPAAAAAGCTTGLALATCVPAGAPGSTPFNVRVYGHPGIELTEFNSNYNSLQVELNRRFSNGLQVLAAYTFSRYFDETSSLENNSFNFPGPNPFNFRGMYGPSANDAPQRFVVSYTYTLPIFKLTHRWKRLTDDWNLSGIYTLQSGFPVPVFDLLGTSLDCDQSVAFFACPDRANRNGTRLRFGNPRKPGNFWVTNATSVFSAPAPGTGIGNANRNPFYGPGINYGDMAIEKNIHIDESKYIQLRLETFNTFNHANFANPATPGFSSEDASPVNAATLGEIFSVRQTSSASDGRVLQLGAKFVF